MTIPVNTTKILQFLCDWVALLIPQGNSYGGLDGIHNKGALDGAQAFDGAQYVDTELVVVLHIGRIYL